MVRYGKLTERQLALLERSDFNFSTGRGAAVEVWGGSRNTARVLASRGLGNLTSVYGGPDHGKAWFSASLEGARLIRPKWVELYEKTRGGEADAA